MLYKKIININDYKDYIFSVLLLSSLVLLMPTNGVGSNGLILVFLFSIVFFKESVDLWWRKNKKLFLIIAMYLLYLVSISFEYKQSLHTAFGVLRGIVFGSCLAIIVLRDVYVEALRKSVYIVLVLMLCLLAGILIFNIQKYGLAQVVDRQWLDTTVHRNRLGVGIAIIFIMTFSVWLMDYKKIWNSLFLIICLLFLCLIAFINHSRGALLAMLAAGCVVSLYWNWRRTLIPLIGIWIFLQWIQANYISIITHANGSVGNGRELLWPLIWQRVQESPIWGYGLHAINNDPVLIAKKIEAVGHVHSIYLDVIYSSGILGILVLLLIASKFFIINKEVVGNKNNVFFEYMGVGLLTYIMIHGLVDYAFYSMAIMMYLSFSCVLLLPIVKRKNHENTPCR